MIPNFSEVDITLQFAQLKEEVWSTAQVQEFGVPINHLSRHSISSSVILEGKSYLK